MFCVYFFLNVKNPFFLDESLGSSVLAGRVWERVGTDPDLAAVLFSFSTHLAISVCKREHKHPECIYNCVTYTLFLEKLGKMESLLQWDKQNLVSTDFFFSSHESQV